MLRVDEQHVHFERTQIEVCLHPFGNRVVNNTDLSFSSHSTRCIHTSSHTKNTLDCRTRKRRRTKKTKGARSIADRYSSICGRMDFARNRSPLPRRPVCPCGERVFLYFSRRRDDSTTGQWMDGFGRMDGTQLGMMMMITLNHNNTALHG